jgi:RNA-directed DNA polymerase
VESFPPLLANSARNSLDWHLHEHGQRFVRYADDLVVLGQTDAAVREAFDLVPTHLTSVGLTLSAEKTKRNKFREGFVFLGFAISSWRVPMRPKAVGKFKTKIRELTPRHHNRDQEVIPKLNWVIRGTANYFATTFSCGGDRFRGLDRWIRIRLRCMKCKRTSRADNGRFRLSNFRRLGLLALSDLRPAPA